MASIPNLAMDFPQRRGAARLRVSIPAELVLLERNCACSLADISLTGARVACDAPPRSGATAILKCAPLEVLCTVIRVQGKAVGLRFEEEVDLGVIRMLRWHNDSRPRDDTYETRLAARAWVTGRSG